MRLVLTLGGCVVLGCGVSGPQQMPYPYEGDGSGGSGGSAVSSGTGLTVSVGTSSSGSGSGNGSGSGSGNGSGSGAGNGSGSTGAGSTTAASTGSGAGSEVCAPETGDDECVACAKLNCCDEIEACSNDEACLCWVECVQETAGDILACIAECGAPGDGLLDLLDCGQVECPNDCGNLGI